MNGSGKSTLLRLLAGSLLPDTGEIRNVPRFEMGYMPQSPYAFGFSVQKNVEIALPNCPNAENLAGKAAQFKITVKLVEKQKLPEIDAEFLKIFGLTEEEGLDKLKADVRKNMEREVRNGLRNQVKQAAFDALVAANEIEVPASMVAQEIDRQRQQMIQQFTQQFGGQGAGAFDSTQTHGIDAAICKRLGGNR